MGLALSIARREASLDREEALDSGAEIEAFLREVEARAYRIALVHIRDRGEALDIVQDAMIRLVRRYADRPSAEWPPLFYRILQNRIRDVQRRRIVRSRVLSFFGGTASEEEHDPIAEAPAPIGEDPLERAKAADAMQALEQALLDVAGAAARGVHAAQLRGARCRADRHRDELHGRQCEDALLARHSSVARDARGLRRGAVR